MGNSASASVQLRGALNAGQVAYSADELRALTDVSITYIRIIIQCICLFRHFRVSTAAQLAAPHLGFSMKQLKLAAFVYFCLPHNTPDLALQCYYPSYSRWLNGTYSIENSCQQDRFGIADIEGAGAIPVRYHANETAIIPADGAITVPNTDGFSTAQNEVVTVMNTSGGHAAFLIAYHLHTNNGHHWFAAQCVQLRNGLMHDLFHPFTTLHWIQVWSVPGHRAYRLLYLELTLALVRFASICFPFEIPCTGLMEICALSNQPLPIVSVVFDLFSSLVFFFFFLA